MGCQTVGWPPFGASRGEESPGSTGTRCRVTPGEGDLRESATESKPPAPVAAPRRGGWRVRVKGCGKSAPRRRHRRRHGKPHREHDRLGAARRGRKARGRRVSASAARVGRARRPATDVADEWPSPAQAGTEPGLQTVWRFSQIAASRRVPNRVKATRRPQWNIFRT